MLLSFGCSECFGCWIHVESILNLDALNMSQTVCVATIWLLGTLWILNPDWIRIESEWLKYAANGLGERFEYRAPVESTLNMNVINMWQIPYAGNGWLLRMLGLFHLYWIHIESECLTYDANSLSWNYLVAVTGWIWVCWICCKQCRLLSLGCSER